MKVDNHTNYSRDTVNGAIILDNTMEVNKYLKQQKLESDLEKLTLDVKEIRMLLKQILEIKK
jgi:hypothetical protein